MTTLKMTSKRQVTFPAAACKELGVGPGALIMLDRKNLGGQPVWVLQTRTPPPTPWFGSLQRYASDQRHDLQAIRRTIALARRRNAS